MITIGVPHVERNGETVRLTALIRDEKGGVEKQLWYESDFEYGKYFCDEVSDAFVVALSLYAARSQQDIKCESPVSEKLLYNFNTIINYTLSRSWGG